jgi:hypothetical protein
MPSKHVWNAQTAEEHFNEVVAILAGAVVRLRVRAALPGDFVNTEKLPESFPNCLELPSESRLSVHGS